AGPFDQAWSPPEHLLSEGDPSCRGGRRPPLQDAKHLASKIHTRSLPLRPSGGGGPGLRPAVVANPTTQGRGRDRPYSTPNGFGLAGGVRWATASPEGDSLVMRTVPFYRPSIGQAELDEVVTCLKSGWLTTGPKTKQFESAFAEYIQQRYAVAVN